MEPTKHGMLRMEDILIPGAKLEARLLTKEEIQEFRNVMEEYEKKRAELENYWRQNAWWILQQRITI